MTRSVTRRFNYTRRLDIPRAGVEIDLRQTDGGLTANVVRLVLPEPGPHEQQEWGNAHVLVEAWRTDTGTYQRADLGTVAQISSKSPAGFMKLNEFPDEQNITFRLKVVSAATKRILAEADRVSASNDDAQRDELIKVIPKDLGELPWTIDWSDAANDGPKIFVNTNIERNRELLTRDPVVSGLIVSAVLREVLYRAISASDEPEWAKRWKDFGVRVAGGEAPPPDSDEIDEWVEAVLLQFAATHRLSSAIEEHFKKQETV